MSDIYIYQNKVPLGLLQNEISVQWQEFYQRPGEVKLVAVANSENLAWLARGNRLYNTDFDTCARIEQVEVEDDGRTAMMTVRARSTAALLEDRVVIATVQVSNIESGMYAVYGLNRRGLPIMPATARGFPAVLNTEVSWGNVLDAELELAKAGGFGFKVLFNPATAAEVFTVYQGTNRTSGTAYRGYFGLELGNLSRMRITGSAAGMKNVAVVEGGSNGFVETVSAVTVSGEARRELYVDARDLLMTYRVASDSGQRDVYGNPIYTYSTVSHTEAAYRELLRAAGLTALLHQGETLEIDTEEEQHPISFGADYALGDILPVRLGDYGGNMQARVVSVRKVYEAGGEKTVIGLGDFSA